MAWEFEGYNKDDPSNNQIEGLGTNPPTMTDTITRRRETLRGSINNMHKEMEDLQISQYLGMPEAIYPMVPTYK